MKAATDKHSMHNHKVNRKLHQGTQSLYNIQKPHIPTTYVGIVCMVCRVDRVCRVGRVGRVGGVGRVGKVGRIG